MDTHRVVIRGFVGKGYRAPYYGVSRISPPTLDAFYKSSGSHITMRIHHRTRIESSQPNLYGSTLGFRIYVVLDGISSYSSCLLYVVDRGRKLPSP